MVIQHIPVLHVDYTTVQASFGSDEYNISMKCTRSALFFKTAVNVIENVTVFVTGVWSMFLCIGVVPSVTWHMYLYLEAGTQVSPLVPPVNKLNPPACARLLTPFPHFVLLSL